jgi:capsular polysaccharide transport system ATP-binding protein
VILLSDVNHETNRHGKKLSLLSGATFAFGSGHVGLVVKSALEAEVLFDLLVGYIKPKHGHIRRFGRVSWPVGRVLQFRNQLSGRKNLHLLCSMYQLDFDKCELFAHNMMNIHKYFDVQTIDWPRELLLEFSYFAALLPEFDIYLIEGATSTSNEEFNKKWDAEFRKIISNKLMIYQSLSERYMRSYVNSAITLKNGILTYFEELDDTTFDDRPSEALPQFDDNLLI